jgi:hypothetical protein
VRGANIRTVSGFPQPAQCCLASTSPRQRMAPLATQSSSDDHQNNKIQKRMKKPNKPGYNNGMKQRGGHSTKQDPNKVDTSGERVIEPKQVVSELFRECERECVSVVLHVVAWRGVCWMCYKAD